ncbi:MAG: tRNA lysidine(34) synthetase TilS [Magnetospirillum sp. WYHS-4]
MTLPLVSEEFGRLMATVGPFERRPRLAVAVSGGADSLALARLAAVWAEARGGGVTALTVDHGLRPESSAEATRVGDWMATLGIGHRVLRWEGEKPATGIQKAARQARYTLLEDWCRREGVLHLLLAHHHDDQAETYLMRQARLSGPDGLAGMASVVERPAVRFLRPLLDIPKERLRATLLAADHPWIEDPSNRDLRFARARLRHDGIASLAAAEAASRAGRNRTAAEAEVARFLACSAAFHPDGFALVDGAALVSVPPDVARRALERLLMAVGKAAYPPRGDRLERLRAALAEGGGIALRTLGGCRLRPWRGRLRIEPEGPRRHEAVLPAVGVRYSGARPHPPAILGFAVADWRERTMS